MQKVSVIMPCYNDGKYVKEAVESVLLQTYSNIELIIIDDGSEDTRTLDTIKQINGENIIKLRTKHIGPAGARNAGIAVATGKYILPLDADDCIERTYVEKAVKMIESKEEIGVVYCYAELFGEEKGKWNIPAYSIEAMLLDNVVFVTALFYKSDWEKVGGFDVSMKYGMEDYDFWLSVLELNREIVQIPEILFRYRIKKSSRSTRFHSNCETEKYTYRKIYYKHIELFNRYKEEYPIILRNALIENSYRMRKLEERVKIFQKIPFYKLLKKIFRK